MSEQERQQDEKNPVADFFDGRERFGSACAHAEVRGGHCVKCLRRVV